MVRQSSAPTRGKNARDAALRALFGVLLPTRDSWQFFVNTIRYAFIVERGHDAATLTAERVAAVSRASAAAMAARCCARYEGHVLATRVLGHLRCVQLGKTLPGIGADRALAHVRRALYSADSVRNFAARVSSDLSRMMSDSLRRVGSTAGSDIR